LSFISHQPLIYYFLVLLFWYVFEDLGWPALFELEKPNFKNIKWNPSLLFPKSTRSRSKKYALKQL